MSITIRPLRPNDKPDWLPLWHGYVNYYRAKVSDDVTDTSWARLMDEGFDIHGLGAVDEQGKLVGFVHYLFHPVTWAVAPRCYLEDLFTAREARGKGAGRKLIEAVTDAATKLGSDQVYWLTEDYNKRAQYLYDKVAQKTPFIKYQKTLK